MPYFSARNVWSFLGNAQLSSCQVKTAILDRNSQPRIARITPYHASCRSGRRPSRRTRNDRLTVVRSQDSTDQLVGVELTT